MNQSIVYGFHSLEEKVFSWVNAIAAFAFTFEKMYIDNSEFLEKNIEEPARPPAIMEFKESSFPRK